MELSSPKPAAEYAREMSRHARAKPSSLRRFAIFLPWFSRRDFPMQMPLRSVAREFEEWFHPFD